jgi:hypothetical protein
MRFGQQRHVDGTAAVGDMAVAQLVGEDGLAAAGVALDDVDARAEESAAEQDVEAGDAARRSKAKW